MYVWFAYWGTDVSAPSISAAGAVAALGVAWALAGAGAAVAWVLFGRPRHAAWTGLVVWMYLLVRAAEDELAFGLAPASGFVIGLITVASLLRRSNRDGSALADLTSREMWQAPRR